jgi:hypothetical protein
MKWLRCFNGWRQAFKGDSEELPGRPQAVSVNNIVRSFEAPRAGRSLSCTPNMPEELQRETN